MFNRRVQSLCAEGKYRKSAMNRRSVSAHVQLAMGVARRSRIIFQIVRLARLKMPKFFNVKITIESTIALSDS